MVAPLVVLVGKPSEIHGQIDQVLQTRAVLLIAPTSEDARLWLKALEDSPEECTSLAPIQAGDLEVDLAIHRASWRGEILPLTENELQILSLLDSVPRRAWSFGEILKEVWGDTYRGDSSLVRSAIKRLRRKLARAGGELRVEAVRGVGFCLAACEKAGPIPGGRAERIPKPGWEKEGC